MRVWFRILSGGLAGQTRMVEIPLGGVARIGRADDNDIVLEPRVDIAASSYHLQLRNEHGALTMYDVGSTNGTYIRGKRVNQSPIQPGERIRFGPIAPEVEVAYETETMVVPPPRQVAPAAAPAVPERTQLTPQPGAPGGAKVGPPSVLIAPQPLPVAGRGPGGPPMPMPVQGQPQAPARGPAPQPAHFQAEPQRTVPPPPAAAPPCQVCGLPLGTDKFICYSCRRTQCAAHYDVTTGVCQACAPVRQAHAGGTTTAAMQKAAPPMAVSAAQARAGAAAAMDEGVEDYGGEGGEGDVRSTAIRASPPQFAPVPGAAAQAPYAAEPPAAPGSYGAPGDAPGYAPVRSPAPGYPAKGRGPEADEGPSWDVQKGKTAPRPAFGGGAPGGGRPARKPPGTGTAPNKPAFGAPPGAPPAAPRQRPPDGSPPPDDELPPRRRR